MRIPLPILLRPPPPTFIERVVGRRRARRLRRRLGFAAVGVGLALLRPRPRHRAGRAAMVVGAVLISLVAVGIAGSLR